MKKSHWYNIKEAARWYSTQAFALLAMLPLIWSQLPDETKAIIPAEWMPYIVAGVALAGLIGRMRKQGDDNDG